MGKALWKAYCKYLGSAPNKTRDVGKRITIPQITIDRWYKPFPSGWFMALLTHITRESSLANSRTCWTAAPGG